MFGYTIVCISYLKISLKIVQRGNCIVNTVYHVCDVWLNFISEPGNWNKNKIKTGPKSIYLIKKISCYIQQSKFTNDAQGTSILTFTPRRDSDYGSIACRSTNLAGQQIDPCRFTIIPGVKPEAPYNCTAVNLTDDSVELKCFAGLYYECGCTHNMFMCVRFTKQVYKRNRKNYHYFFFLHWWFQLKYYLKTTY